MPTRHVIISAHNGVHARPVAELVRLAQSHRDPITLRTKGGAEVDLSSVLAVMDLALAQGDEVIGGGGSAGCHDRSARAPRPLNRSPVDHGDQLIQERLERRATAHDALHALTFTEDLDQLFEHRLERGAVALAERRECHHLHASLAP